MRPRRTKPPITDQDRLLKLAGDMGCAVMASGGEIEVCGPDVLIRGAKSWREALIILKLVRYGRCAA